MAKSLRAMERIADKFPAEVSKARDVDLAEERAGRMTPYLRRLRLENKYRQWITDGRFTLAHVQWLSDHNLINLSDAHWLIEPLIAKEFGDLIQDTHANLVASLYELAGRLKDLFRELPDDGYIVARYLAGLVQKSDLNEFQKEEVMTAILEWLTEIGPVSTRLAVALRAAVFQVDQALLQHYAGLSMEAGQEFDKAYATIESGDAAAAMAILNALYAKAQEKGADVEAEDIWQVFQLLFAQHLAEQNEVQQWPEALTENEIENAPGREDSAVLNRLAEEVRHVNLKQRVDTSKALKWIESIRAFQALQTPQLIYPIAGLIYSEIIALLVENRAVEALAAIAKLGPEERQAIFFNLAGRLEMETPISGKGALADLEALESEAERMNENDFAAIALGLKDFYDTNSPGFDPNFDPIKTFSRRSEMRRPSERDGRASILRQPAQGEVREQPPVAVDFSEKLMPAVKTLGKFVKEDVLSPQEFWDNVAVTLDHMKSEGASVNEVTAFLHDNVRKFIAAAGTSSAIAKDVAEQFNATVLQLFSPQVPGGGAYAVYFSGQEDLGILAQFARDIAQQLDNEENTLLIASADRGERKGFADQLDRQGVKGLHRVPIPNTNGINPETYLGPGQERVPVVYNGTGRSFREGLAAMGASHDVSGDLPPADLALLQLSRTLLQFAAARYLAFAKQSGSLNAMLKAALIKNMGLESQAEEIKGQLDFFLPDGQGLAVSEKAVFQMLSFVTQFRAKQAAGRAA